MPSKNTTSLAIYKCKVECGRAPTLDFEDVKILENPLKILRKYGGSWPLQDIATPNPRQTASECHSH